MLKQLLNPNVGTRPNFQSEYASKQLLALTLLLTLPTKPGNLFLHMRLRKHTRAKYQTQRFRTGLSETERRGKFKVMSTLEHSPYIRTRHNQKTVLNKTSNDEERIVFF